MSDQLTSLLSPKQRWSVNQATKRLNLWHGSVRSGKTWGTLYAWAKFILKAPPGNLLMAGKTIDSLKRNVIDPMIDILGTNEVTYFSGRREVRCFGRVIYTVGASDERSEQKIRGATLAGALGDEITLWPESFFQMMLSRMSIEGAQFFGTTNPDNPRHWLKKNYIDRKKKLKMSLFHFDIMDNPFLPKSYVESLKEEYTGLWYKRFILGEWCVAEGAVYDFFDEEIHTRYEFPEAKHYYVGYDYGTTNPTTFGIYGVNPATKPKIWLEREYYYDPQEQKAQKTDEEFAEDLIKFVGNQAKNVRSYIGDPAAESFNLTLKRKGIHTEDANNEVLDGIRTVGRMMKAGEYAVDCSARHTINEYCSYSWDSKKAERGEDAPIKKGDHAMDRDRYVLHTIFGQDRYDISKFMEGK